MGNEFNQTVTLGEVMAGLNGNGLTVTDAGLVATTFRKHFGNICYAEDALHLTELIKHLTVGNGLTVDDSIKVERYCLKFLFPVCFLGDNIF